MSQERRRLQLGFYIILGIVGLAYIALALTLQPVSYSRLALGLLFVVASTLGLRKVYQMR
jgi:predicted membrane channel-forming protein YqfA (hemolysin III family)